jgi:hypothetical protein
MRKIGIATTAVLCLTGIVAGVVALRSIPDIQRYLRIRAM